MEQKQFKSTFTIFYESLKTAIELTKGARLLARMQHPIVTIFGGAKVSQKTRLAQQAYTLGYMCAQKDFSILTGGGPGIMYSANCGAIDGAKNKDTKKIFSAGIGVYGVDEDFENNCAQFLPVTWFSTRKYLLFRYSIAIVVFPGGIGTADEVFTIFNLLKHDLIARYPLILIGRDYWKGGLEWYENAIEKGYIEPQFRNFITVTDDINEAFSLIHKRV